MSGTSATTKLSKHQLEAGSSFAPQFDANGWMPAVVTEAGTGEVLMLAYMNADALALTLKTGEAHFWSRSRRAIWRKGETSGNTLRVVELRTDCDQDTLLVVVAIGGDAVACHTGRKSCFYRRVEACQDGATQLAFVDET